MSISRTTHSPISLTLAPEVLMKVTVKSSNLTAYLVMFVVIKPIMAVSTMFGFSISWSMDVEMVDFGT